jgi:two-component system OmpR family sensor kinase
MLYLSSKTNDITDQKIGLLYKEKYIQASKELLPLIIDENIPKLDKKVNELNYKKLSINTLPLKYTTIYSNNISFGKVSVYQDDKGYYLYMKYLDDEVLFYDNSQKKEFEQKEHLNYLIIADIAILMIMFLTILKILTPLKKISKGIEKFGKGDYSSRLDKSRNNDEISKVINEFNSMAQNLEDMINSRKQLLNDISHELRTPISKAKIALEMTEENKYKEMLNRSIIQIDELTNELLELERLNSNNLNLNIQTCSIDTVLAQALSKMLIEDENNIEVMMNNIFKCNADINYLSIAVKNLIDNAIKYKEKGKVRISVDDHNISVKNFGKPLQKDLDFYTQTFTQDDNSRAQKGYGLGLNIVKRVLEHHRLELEYLHDKGENIFKITFPPLHGKTSAWTTK